MLGKQIEGVEPLLTPDDCLLAEEIVKRDYTVKDLCESRGLHDMDLVACDPWSGAQHREIQMYQQSTSKARSYLLEKVGVCGLTSFILSMYRQSDAEESGFRIESMALCVHGTSSWVRPPALASAAACVPMLQCLLVNHVVTFTTAFRMAPDIWSAGTLRHTFASP